MCSTCIYILRNKSHLVGINLFGTSCSNKRMLKADTTEILTLCTSSRVKEINSISDTIEILNSTLPSQKSVKYLGVRLDQLMSNHINDISRSLFISLRRFFQHHSSYLSRKAMSWLVNSIITSRLDFCNSTLVAGVTADQLVRLQRIQNSAAQLIARQR